MAPAGIVPTLDKLEDRHAGLGLGLEFPPVEQLAFQGREEALAERIGALRVEKSVATLDGQPVLGASARCRARPSAKANPI